MKGKIVTVLGDIEPTQAGTVITHEHLIVDVSLVYSEPKTHESHYGNEKISLEKLCEFWMEIQKESLGDIFKFDEETGELVEIHE